MISHTAKRRQSPPPEAPAHDVALADANLPAAIIARLAGYNVRTVSDWCRLTRKQKCSMFGVTKAIARTVDVAIKAHSR